MFWNNKKLKKKSTDQEKLTMKDLDEFFKNAYKINAQQSNFTLYTGKKGLMEFDKAVKEAAYYPPKKTKEIILSSDWHFMPSYIGKGKMSKYKIRGLSVYRYEERDLDYILTKKKHPGLKIAFGGSNTTSIF